MEDILHSCQLFGGMQREDILPLLESVGYRVIHFEKNECLKTRGDAVSALMIILSGSVRGEMFGDAGKVLKIEDILPSMPVAGAFVFGGNNTYPVDVIANERGSALAISKASLVKALQMREEMLQNYLDFISNRAQFLSRKIFFLSFKSIKAKFAHYIVSLNAGSEEEVVLKQTQQELADFFGVTRSSLARAIGEMQREGMIETGRRRVRIIDRKKLLAV